LSASAENFAQSKGFGSAKISASIEETQLIAKIRSHRGILKEHAVVKQAA
jgi:hypothetical protein